MVCHHLFLLLRQLQPYFHVFFLWHRHTLTHTHTLGVGGWGGAWLVKEAKLDQRPCVREPGYLVENSCPLLSLPLTPAWQQPEIWGLSRPLSWGKRTGQHTYSQNSFCLCSFSLSPWLTRTYKEERKLFVHAQSLIQPQTEIFVSHVHSLCQPHKTIKWSHAWFLFIVCLLNSFISCFSQFGRNLSATLHFPFSLLLSSPPPKLSVSWALLNTVSGCFSSPILLSPPFVATCLGLPSLCCASPVCSNSDRVEKGIQLTNPGSLYQEC